MGFKENIKKLRLKNNLKQSELAEKAGTSRVSIGNYERGESIPNVEILLKIADALDVPMSELVGSKYEEIKNINSKENEKMRKEQLKEIKDRLELLTEREREGLIGELDAMIEEKNRIVPREKLFEAVKNIIYEIGDISIKNQHGVRTGIGKNLIDDESKDENVSLCYMLDTDQLELVHNGETILEITKDSPVLEAFQELFKELELEQ